MTGKVAPYRNHPFSGIHTTWNLEPGTKLARVWNHKSGSARGFGATSWNPRRLPGGDDDAGRFDPLPPPVADAGYLYGSEGGQGEKVALLETFRSLMWRDDLNSGRNTCSRTERNSRSITIFQVPEPVTLIDLNTQRGRECFRMDEEVLYVHDRFVTRQWGQALKAQLTDRGGIAYNSTRESVPLKRRSFILWEDRVPFKSFLEERTVDLGSPKGRDMVENALEDYDIVWL